MKEVIRPYRNDSQYSYATGAYAVIELLAVRSKHVEMVVIHSAYRDTDSLITLCREKSVSIVQDDRLFKRLSQKENTYVLGIFRKYACQLSQDKPHVVLVNPSDMGNLGTTIRTLAGVNITNLAIITPAADMWHPKTVRASMGALFHIEMKLFSSFNEYRSYFQAHKLYTFILNGELWLTPQNCPCDDRFSLIFGNEATGLPDFYRSVGSSVRLPQSNLVDSLNLSIAVGIGTFLFANASGQI